MPLSWKIDSREGLVTVLAEGDVTRAEMESYLDAVVGAGALGYRKLFDGRSSHISMPPEELLAIGHRFRSLHDGPVGPLALVVSPDKWEKMERVAGMLAAANRPMRIFKTLKPAQRWIEGLKTVDGP